MWPRKVKHIIVLLAVMASPAWCALQIRLWSHWPEVD
jgi:hypothetical protein